MNVLLIGSGGREHALAHKICQSPLLKNLFIAPGNAGTLGLSRQSPVKNIDLDISNHGETIRFCKKNKIDLVVVGPEVPLVAGIGDDLKAAKILVFGPGKKAAQLEGSKKFTKELCKRMQIPTADYESFDNCKAALEFLHTRTTPIVIKADGLAAGKGVTVAKTIKQAEKAVYDCFAGQHGNAGTQVIIEEFLEGEEVSFFAVCDGRNFISLATAQDHKRAFDGDEGPNTGGMGAFSPAPILTDELAKQVEIEIIAPTMLGMQELNASFSGVLYAGLILTDQGPKLIEYNVRFGDPECQVLMMRLQSDLLEILLASAKGDLSGINPVWLDNAALSVVMATRGYPGSYENGSKIGSLEGLENGGVKIFHAGTLQKEETLVANGGRVLNVTAMAPSISEARKKAYSIVEKIDWDKGFWRTDIGRKATKTIRETK